MLVTSVSLDFFQLKPLLDNLAFLIHTFCTVVIKIDLKDISLCTLCLHFKVFTGLKGGDMGRRGNGRAWDTKIKKMWSLTQGANGPAGELEACTAD